MKRLFVLIAAVITLGGTTFAQDNNGKEYAILSKLAENGKLDGLAKYLEADMLQKDYLEEIFALSLQKMGKADGSIASEKNLKKAMTFNLANMKSVLTPEQYKKYLTVLNLTANNMNKPGWALAKK